MGLIPIQCRPKLSRVDIYFVAAADTAEPSSLSFSFEALEDEVKISTSK